jgi:plastocyanin
MRKLLLLVAGLAAFVAVGALTFAAQKPAATVNMNGSAFTPESVTITVGQSVQFINDDDLPHTVTATDKSFDSGNIDPKHNWSYTFAKAGTYVYGCTYHSWMHGTVKVLAPSTSSGSGSTSSP